jgi:hypothetical protein
MTVYDFDTMLAYSRGVRERTDLDTILALIDGCTDVSKTDTATDRAGVDYVATLRGGARVLIDAKARTPGCSRYWKHGPELALEVWSVLPDRDKRQAGKVGWTLSESSGVHYILFTFDPADTPAVFLYPFQLLRMAFRRNLKTWQKGYKVDKQNSGQWRSECVFVPESVVWDGIYQAMRQQSPFYKRAAD